MPAVRSSWAGTIGSEISSGRYSSGRRPADEQVRGEEHLHVGVVALARLATLPGQLLGALPAGGPALGVVAVNLQVPEPVL